MSMVNPPPLPTYEELVNSNIEGMSSFIKRFERIQQYGFPIIHKDTVEVLRKFLRYKKVIELCSGNGYLAYQLKNVGVDITAIDNASGSYNELNWKEHVYLRDRIENVRHRYYYYNQYKCIILSWPDYQDDLAYIVASRMKKGQILIYQGESKYGCTANDKFFDYIDKNFYSLKPFQNLLNKTHLQYCGIHDYWYILKKEII